MKLSNCFIDSDNDIHYSKSKFSRFFWISKGKIISKYTQHEYYSPISFNEKYYLRLFYEIGTI